MNDQQVRVLIVEDSRLTQNILRSILEKANMNVVAMAQHGQEALDILTHTTVDIILLDMEMPVMNGLEFLAAVRKAFNPPPILLVSALTQRHAQITIEGLLLGAAGYICKPTTKNGRFQDIAPIIVDKINAILSKNKQTSFVPNLSALGTNEGEHPQKSWVINHGIVAIGVSTGGPKVLEELIQHIPKHFSVPIVIVQHMPPIFTRMLAESLSQRTALRVREAAGGEIIKGGDIWLAPGNKHLKLELNRDGNTVIKLSNGPKENSCRPSVDVLFRSVANIYGRKALGIILTGMGQDGLLGAVSIRRNGGQIIAQDEKSSIVWGMPKSVIDANQASMVLSIKEITEFLKKMNKKIEDS
jgi:two-component system, chemotaxis family, protein-glutamate methylesterase/glutaminase